VFGSLRAREGITVGADTTIHGDVTTRGGTVTVEAGARVLGDVSAGDLVVHDGAEIDGTLRARGEMKLVQETGDGDEGEGETESDDAGEDEGDADEIGETDADELSDEDGTSDGDDSADGEESDSDESGVEESDSGGSDVESPDTEEPDVDAEAT